MFVAVARLSLAIPESDSPKHKRQIVGKIVERIRGKFNASVAEVETIGSWQSAVIGISVVGNEQGAVQNHIERILRVIDDMYAAPVVSRAVEVIPLGTALHADAALDQLAAKLEADFSMSSAADGSDGAARDEASEGGNHRASHGKKKKNAADESDWPEVKTLADVEDPNDPEAAGYRAPPKSRQTGKKKSPKDMSPEERAAAIRALADEMKRPRD